MPDSLSLCVYACLFFHIIARFIFNMSPAEKSTWDSIHPRIGIFRRNALDKQADVVSLIKQIRINGFYLEHSTITKNSAHFQMSYEFWWDLFSVLQTKGKSWLKLEQLGKWWKFIGKSTIYSVNCLISLEISRMFFIKCLLYTLFIRKHTQTLQTSWNGAIQTYVLFQRSKELSTFSNCFFLFCAMSFVLGFCVSNLFSLIVYKPRCCFLFLSLSRL